MYVFLLEGYFFLSFALSGRETTCFDFESKLSATIT